uniref:Uncharacterized protein n=1 Tax=Kuenenia stuttgartiensis TaxID=174633 RepID=Q1Q3H3_KUEST|nr:unknown protein [Candidatus Kuenenia stuttgartiensis]
MSFFMPALRFSSLSPTIGIAACIFALTTPFFLSTTFRYTSGITSKSASLLRSTNKYKKSIISPETYSPNTALIVSFFSLCVMEGCRSIFLKSACLVIVSESRSRSFSICPSKSLSAATSRSAFTKVTATLLSNTQPLHIFNHIINQRFRSLLIDGLLNYTRRSQHRKGNHLVPDFGKGLFPFLFNAFLRLQTNQFRFILRTAYNPFAKFPPFIDRFLNLHCRSSFDFSEFHLIVDFHLFDSGLIPFYLCVTAFYPFASLLHESRYFTKKKLFENKKQY